jgi:amino acid transporter
MYSTFKRALIGPRLETSEESSQKIGKATGLAVLASDAISSSAYATQEILQVLVPLGGLAAFGYLTPISVVVVVLLVVLVMSYRQTIYAYPNGGGSYVVSRENLGVAPSLVAGASLIVDYILTVAVSVSAGVAAIIAVYDEAAPYRVELCLGFIALIALTNLRGLRSSGRAFTLPTYVYIGMLALLIGWGLLGSATGDVEPLPADADLLDSADATGAFAGVTAIALLRAFSSGAVALTGVEAISNGVTAFRDPRSRNASRTLIAMGTIVGTAFVGLAILAQRLEPIASEDETTLSVLATAVFGGHSFFFYVLQFATFAILVLAANTAFADFPRVASIMARDGFMPQQLGVRGDRLVFSNGIILLTLVAGLLIVVFDGLTSELIPLYAVGVFTSFTLSQAGMVLHHRRTRETAWRMKLGLNALGALATLTVLGVVVVSKFLEGAWIPVVLIPILVATFLAIKRHYTGVDRVLALGDDDRFTPSPPLVALVVGMRLTNATLTTVGYAASLAPVQLTTLIARPARREDELRAEWARLGMPGELRLLPADAREITTPVIAVIDQLAADHPGARITVVLPDVIIEHWYDRVLHNQGVLALRAALADRTDVVVAAVPISLEPPGDQPGVVSGTRLPSSRSSTSTSKSSSEGGSPHSSTP